MQHAGLQYGQGAANSHHPSPPFADISQTGGNTTSSLRQFRKKEGPEKGASTDLNPIARVPPHNHYPARPNDFYNYKYQHQYPDYNSPYKETPAPVKYSEIAETPPQHVDLPKHKDVPKDFMDMCNMKQNYPQQYPNGTVHHPQLHPESQYQQYPQMPKYNMASQCRKYPPQENDFLAKLQRINPTMARSIMSDHHMREPQSTYQNQMYPQNQRYYSYNYQPYNYPSSCNYRTNQMAMGGAQYPHSDRSHSPRNLMMNYGTAPQKISPNYGQYQTPEYAQHYQHRRTSMPQEYYQQPCRTGYLGTHQIPPEANENRTEGGGLRHFIENWAEEEGPSEITPRTNNEQVYVINSSDFPPCLENVSLVPTENGQYIIKSGALDNSVVRIKETTENNGERTVNLQIVEAPKTDCLLEEIDKAAATEEPVPCQNCDEEKTSQPEKEEKGEEKNETSVIVPNEVSVIKDMPLIEEEEKTAEATIKDLLVEESHVTTTTKRTQRIFSVDDIINNIGNSPTQTRRNSLQFVPKGEETEETPTEEEEREENGGEVELRDAITVEDNSVILEIGGALVQLNINHFNGTKVLSVLPLSESLVIDVNGNYEDTKEESEKVDEEDKKTNEEIEEMEKTSEETCVEIEETKGETEEIEETKGEAEEIQETKVETVEIEEIKKTNEEIDALPECEEHMEVLCQSEVVIGEESAENEVFLELTTEEKNIEEERKSEEKEKPVVEKKKEERRKSKERDEKRKPRRKDSDEKLKPKKNKDVGKKEETEGGVKKKPPSDVPKPRKHEKKEKDVEAKKKPDEETKKSEETEKPPTKAAMKLYEPVSKLEETVNRIKSLKEANKPVVSSVKKSPKKVTFNLDPEIDRKKLSWKEYSNRKRKSLSVTETEPRKIMEDTVTSSDDINDEVVEKVALSIENAIKVSAVKKSPPPNCNWEEDSPSPEPPTKSEAISTTNHKCIIDVNEFNIKPMEAVSTPSPVSSSQFSYHSEEDSLQVYKDVVDSKLSSLNIKIPKLTKPKPVDKLTVLLDRFLNKGTLNCEELEEVKKFIELKRKMMGEKKLTYEVRNEREYKDLKLHFKKVPRKKKRFRNLYTEDSSDSDSSRSEEVGDYSVYQQDSQGVPKLIIKRKSGLPQPFVKLERSQAVELLAKKRKLY